MIRNKTGFLLNAADVGHHYQGIWRLLEPDSFELILYSDQEAIRKRWGDRYGCVDYQEVIERNWKYRYLISHQFLGWIDGDENKEPIIKRLGCYNIRMMYALGKSGWQLGSWNAYYDLVLCYGPYQAGQLSRYPNLTVIQVGYPRYDDYFNRRIDGSRYRSEWQLDPAKPTLVWLPTYTELSSIPYFTESISRLGPDFNIIVKPHPGTVSYESDNMALLLAAGFSRVVDTTFDNQILLSLADYVLCDYGGSPFGALYTDRNLLLLNVPDAERNPNLGADSSDLELRKQIRSVDPGENLKSVLKDDLYWIEQQETRARLRQRYFAPYYGFASEIASQLIRNLDRIFRSFRPQPEFLLRQAGQLLELEMVDEARHGLDEVLFDQPENVAALNQAAVAAIMAHDYPAAMNYLQAAQAVEPENPASLELQALLVKLTDGGNNG